MTMFSQFNLLLQLLLRGLQVDFIYNLVIVLVITALFSTPLILGSIKSKVYVAVKEQVERENNAKEITIQQTDSSLKNDLGKQFLENIQNNIRYKNKYKIIGNYQYVITVEGPQNSQHLTIDTLVPNDPKSDFLQIKQQVPDDFGLFDVVISDRLGELLYGKSEWLKLWGTNNNSPQFTGSPLSLSINNGLPIEGKFRVVARQTSPGLKIYGSTLLGEALKKYSIGLGAKELGLPVVKDLVQYALPKFETSQCVISFPQDCTTEQQTNLIKRLRSDNYQTEDIDKNRTVFENVTQVKVTLTKIIESKDHVEIKPMKDDCETRLSHHLNVCPAAVVTPLFSIEAASVVSKISKEPYSVTLASISPRSYELLPDIQKMKDQYGGGATFKNDGLLENGIEIIVPYGVNAKIGELLSLQMGAEVIPAFVSSYYSCLKPISCPFYANAKMVFRLQNVIDGTATFYQREAPLFYPVEKYIKIDHDKILVYANQVEEVETLHQQLKQDFPNYSVEYNNFAINKLKRQDQRLSTLFGLTLILSVIFIIFAVGALAKINIDRRKRQMAQLFILGYSKKFVGILLICEYLFLTVVASLLALGIGWGIFASARHFFSVEGSSTEFNTVINAMTLDIGAFGFVFAIVMSITIMVAIFAAYLTSKSDPIALLN